MRRSIITMGRSRGLAGINGFKDVVLISNILLDLVLLDLVLSLIGGVLLGLIGILIELTRYNSIRDTSNSNNIFSIIDLIKYLVVL